jgi:hypothetical protein
VSRERLARLRNEPLWGARVRPEKPDRLRLKKAIGFIEVRSAFFHARMPTFHAGAATEGLRKFRLSSTTSKGLYFHWAGNSEVTTRRPAVGHPLTHGYTRPDIRRDGSALPASIPSIRLRTPVSIGNLGRLLSLNLNNCRSLTACRQAIANWKKNAR